MSLQGYNYLLTGSDGILWEPLWQLETKLLPVEVELLKSRYIRRLQYIHHCGLCHINTNQIQTRLQHCLGVLSLTAYFSPEDILLRVSSLLHDVGHTPFSHSIEEIDEINHNDFTGQILSSTDIADTLKAHNLDPGEVYNYIEGCPPNILRNRDGLLHIDHFENVIRHTYMDGILPITPNELLKKVHINGCSIETDLHTGELLVDVIEVANKLVYSTINLGANAILTEMVNRLISSKVTTPQKLSEMSEGMMEILLLTNDITKEDAAKLWYQPQDILIEKVEDASNTREAGFYITQNKLYLSMPMVDGKKITEISEHARNIIEALKPLRGTYRAYFK